MSAGHYLISTNIAKQVKAAAGRNEAEVDAAADGNDNGTLRVTVIYSMNRQCKAETL